MTEREAEFLFINNNNTRTKFALASRGSLLDHRSLPTAEMTAAGIREVLEGWHYDSVVLASVVPGKLDDLRRAQDGKSVLEVSHEVSLGVEIDFDDPSTVGADRLANAAAVAGEYPGEGVVVVDFGTAVTFDIIDSRPAYVGGVIAPGLDAMQHYLHRRTALLPEIEIVRPERAIGRSTVEAMQSGAFHGYRGLVREILERVRGELGEPARVVATGGHAALIADGIEEIESVIPRLTMEGLLKIANLNFPA